MKPSAPLTVDPVLAMVAVTRTTGWLEFSGSAPLLGFLARADTGRDGTGGNHVERDRREGTPVAQRVLAAYRDRMGARREAGADGRGEARDGSGDV